ncbi:Y-family DNA polymerase [Derxia lacustris]|uniref:Y-family DNA polymerase n=1 Tax=Derxia lacustris TaxID=764842 RepID=UPI000A16F93E|nr:DNA polymerase IV [Derxia lacustris]
MPADRVIAHLDMDAFYASVELLRYPELRGLPVVVGGGRDHAPRETALPDGRLRREFQRLRGYVGRGVVTTATYEARALGVHSALGMMKAAALAPDAILLPTDFDQYRRHSRLFKAAVAAIAPQMEDRGIDEIYLDLTELTGSGPDRWARARELGQRLKDAVRDATGGLSCSVGLTPNKLLSKLASEFDKPDGLTVLTLDDIPARIWPLPARRVNGIGPKAAARLEAIGIVSVGDLARHDVADLVERFGRSYGLWLHAVAHGRDDRPVVTESEPKSISRETTFERDLHPRADRELLGGIFTRLCERVADDLLRKGYAGRTIGLKLRYDDFRTVTRDASLPLPVADAKAIRRAAGECLKRVPLERRIRLLGVRVAGLVPLAEAAELQAREESAPRGRTLDLFADAG